MKFKTIFLGLIISYLWFTAYMVRVDIQEREKSYQQEEVKDGSTDEYVPRYRYADPEYRRTGKDLSFISEEEGLKDGILTLDLSGVINVEMYRYVVTSIESAIISSPNNKPLKKIRVYLNSKGGSVEASLHISAFIRDAGVETEGIVNVECSSACVNILNVLDKRIMEDDAILMVHGVKTRCMGGWMGVIELTGRYNRMLPHHKIMCAGRYRGKSQIRLILLDLIQSVNTVYIYSFMHIWDRKTYDKFVHSLYDHYFDKTLALKYKLIDDIKYERANTEDTRSETQDNDI